MVKKRKTIKVNMKDSKSCDSAASCGRKQHCTNIQYECVGCS